MQKNKKIVGTLLPLSALPVAKFASAADFLSWLEQTNQSAWQLLPLHETQLETGSNTKHVPSPYKSYGIGLDPRFQSAANSANSKNSDFKKKFEGFLEVHKDWIYDYALFCALRDEFGTDDWRMWDSDIRSRKHNEIAKWSEKLQDHIIWYMTQQMNLHEEYAELRRKANSLGIALIGDLPYYPSVNSPLVWAHQEVFQIDSNAQLPYVSGIPDTPGTFFGRQVWGHPLYDWNAHKDKVLGLWKIRLRYLATIFDHIRFDHAKAFFSYGVMDIQDPLNDHYAKGPGPEIFKELVDYSHSQGLTIFTEDSGDRTEALRQTLSKYNIPGLRIFRFAIKGFEIDERYADIQQYPENCVAYTTTHDTETLLGFLLKLTAEQKQKLCAASSIEYTTDDKSLACMIRNAYIASNAKMVIIPIQDWLLTVDRINMPGTEKEVDDPNWQYKLSIPIADLPRDLLED